MKSVILALGLSTFAASAMADIPVVPHPGPVLKLQEEALEVANLLARPEVVKNCLSVLNNSYPESKISEIERQGLNPDLTKYWLKGSGTQGGDVLLGKFTLVITVASQRVDDERLRVYTYNCEPTIEEKK